MSYGTCKWTCGECGESYEASGVVGDLKVDRWAREHRERHRVEKSPTTKVCCPGCKRPLDGAYWLGDSAAAFDEQTAPSVAPSAPTQPATSSDTENQS